MSQFEAYVNFAAPPEGMLLPRAHEFSQEGVSVESVLQAAMTGECLSEHPIGKAIVARASSMKLASRQPEQFKYFPGKGIHCVAGGEDIVIGSRAFLDELGIPINGYGNGAGTSFNVFVAQNHQFLGTVAISDTLRPEAVDSVAAEKPSPNVSQSMKSKLNYCRSRKWNEFRN
jgi:cation transport ATPase